MTIEEVKVIVHQREPIVLLLEDMMAVIGVHHHESEALLDNEPTHGYRHRAEDMDVHEVGPQYPIGAAHEPLPRQGILVPHPMKEGDHHQEGSRPEEMIGSDHRHCPKTGALSRHTVIADHGMRLVLATATGGHVILLLGTKSSDLAPPSGIQSGVSLGKSPVHASHRESLPEATKRHPSLSPPRHAPPTQAPLSQPSAIPEPPTSVVAKPDVVAQRARSRSPVQSSLPSKRSSNPPGRSPYRNQIGMEPSHSQKRIEPEDRSAVAHHSSVSSPGHTRVSSPQTGGTRIGGNIPTQPKNHGAFPQPPSGPYQGSRPSSQHHHGSPHVSLLSAPTRPRRGLGPRETWMGTPPARRGGAVNSQVPPSGPRASFSSPSPGGGYRYPTFRQPSTSSAAQQQSTSKGTNHLAALCTIIPEGRSLPSLLDPAVEKRLAQLELDQEKLLEQVAETQRSKRAQLREWDRLDRESSIFALKSELAEGHLQRMTAESIGSGTLF
ncbi:hypothetical protein N7461_001030 [Penicillium sp. DV-2018c]|nr:hypothetical protein N7461_001030 [Penicillium sp. DV-2018c]